MFLITLQGQEGASFAARELRGQLPAEIVEIHSSPDGQALQSELRSLLAAGKNPALVVVWMAPAPALTAARILRRVGTKAEILFVLPEPDAESFRKKAIHTPLGAYRIVATDDAGLLAKAVSERLGASRQRKTFHTTIDRINIQLAERAVPESTELRRLAISDRYRASLLANAADAIFSVDRDGYVTAWNNSAGRLFHIEHPEGLRFKDLPLGDCGQQLDRWIRAVIAGEPVLRQQITSFVRPEIEVAIEATFAPVYDDDRSVIGVSVIARDVRAELRAERLLQLEHQVTRVLVEPGPLHEIVRRVLELVAAEVHASVGEFWSTNETREFLEAEVAWHQPDNSALREFTEKSRELRLRKGEGLPGRVWGEPSFALVADPGSDPNFPRAPLARKAGLKSGFALPIVTTSEFLGAINFFAGTQLNPEPDTLKMITAVATDLAQYIHRRRAEKALEESARRMRFMAESMPQKIFTARPGGGVDYLNQQWTACSTAPLSELFDWGWTRLIHPEDLEKTLQSWRHALETRQPHEVEHRIQSAGGEYRWHLTRARPMFDGNGNILLWIGSSTDIEDRKQAEFRLEKVVAERTAALRETVAELESFSYSISHDMRAPLRAMQQYAQVLIEEQRERLTPEGVSHLERIASAAARLDQLIRDILTYSRVTRENLVLAPVDLEKLVRELIEQSPALQNPARVEIQGALAPVLGHEAAVMQCISNLILNAVKFVPPGRAPHVRIWTEPRGDFVRLWVEDNGIGISPENQKRVFDIFVRVHPQSAYPGTGIGLSIVRKAAMKMGGTVGVESELGKGSRFWIELRKPQL